MLFFSHRLSIDLVLNRRTLAAAALYETYNIPIVKKYKKRKILIAFDDMIADIMTNKKFQAIIKELFIRCRKLNISLAVIT